MSQVSPDVDEAPADDTPLVELFGGSARVRLIAAALGADDRELSKSELARLAGVDRSTVYDHLETLLELDVLEVASDNRQGERYRLADSDLTDKLDELSGVTLWKRYENRDDVDYPA